MGKRYLGDFEAEMLAAALSAYHSHLTNYHDRLMCEQLHDWISSSRSIVLDVRQPSEPCTAADGIPPKRT